MEDIRIDELPDEANPSLLHELAAMYGGVATRLSVGQVVALFAGIFDPQGISADAFARENHTGKQAISTVDGLLQALDDRVRTDAAQGLTSAGQGRARANIGAGALAGFRNKLVNGNFTVNQRNGTKTPGVGIYGYDRWKGHASGLEQVIEALPAGEYTLSWGGGGNGTFAGTTAVSPIKAVSAGGNVSVVVPSTATRVSLVPGDARAEDDPFSPRHAQQELALCQRYYFALGGDTAFDQVGSGGATYSSTFAYLPVQFPVPMRVVPSLSFSGSFGLVTNSATPFSVSDLQGNNITRQFCRLRATSTGLTGGHGVILLCNNDANARVRFDAEF